MELPRSLPDELLYSRIIRHFLLSGMTKNKYLSQFYKTKKYSIHPYFTNRLHQYVTNPTADSISSLYNQTLTPFYAYHLPKSKDDIIRLAFDDKCNNLTRICQVTNFREKTSTTLRYCNQCLQNDINKYGISYWHLTHQLPGIIACSKHHQKLVTQTNTCMQQDRKTLLPYKLVPIYNAVPIECRLAEYAETILSKIALNNLYDTPDYFSSLSRLGFITKKHSVRQKHLSEEFFKFTRQFKNTTPTLLPKSIKDFKYLTNLLYNPHHQHPFKHIFFEFWLNDIDAGNIKISTKIISKPRTNKNINSQNIKLMCIEMLKENHSLSEISKKTSKSRTYIKSLARQNNLHFNSSPRKLTDELKSKIFDLAIKGIHRESIANIVNLSIGTIEQEISSHKGLSQIRKNIKHSRTKINYKSKIKIFIENTPNAKQKDIKIALNKEFYWLYHNDKDWLNRVLPAIPTRGK